jgi:hypothetical protein
MSPATLRSAGAPKCAIAEMTLTNVTLSASRRVRGAARPRRGPLRRAQDARASAYATGSGSAPGRSMWSNRRSERCGLSLMRAAYDAEAAGACGCASHGGCRLFRGGEGGGCEKEGDGGGGGEAFCGEGGGSGRTIAPAARGKACAPCSG